MIPVQTVSAGIAWNMVGDKDPITDFISFYLFTDLNNLSCNLMTEHPGSLLNPIPFHDITAANATGQYLDQ